MQQRADNNRRVIRKTRLGPTVAGPTPARMEMRAPEEQRRQLELMLTGRFVTADEAESIGIVTHVYPAALHCSTWPRHTDYDICP